MQTCVMPHGPEPTTSVTRPVMSMYWDTLTFLHWAYEPADVQRLLPPGVTVQTYDDKAWVSLVPFVMGVRLPRTKKPIPWLGNFPETNVRTYVTAADGTEGIWFFSLDATRIAPIVSARAAFWLPYMWSAMKVERVGNRVTYTCRRRVPGPRGALSRVVVDVGPRYEPNELTELDHFLSARWRLYSAFAGRIWSARAVHEVWPLQRATLIECDDELMVAAGLPKPLGAPLIGFSERVDVNTSVIRRVRG
jgi:uncharacterized protein